MNITAEKDEHAETKRQKKIKATSSKPAAVSIPTKFPYLRCRLFRLRNRSSSTLFLSEENFEPDSRKTSTELAPPLNAQRANKPLRTWRETPWTELRKVFSRHSKFARHYHHPPLSLSRRVIQCGAQVESNFFLQSIFSKRCALACVLYAHFSKLTLCVKAFVVFVLFFLECA